MNKKVNNSDLEERIKEAEKTLKQYFISYIFISFIANSVIMAVVYFLIMKKTSL